ncbi:hypothetical protein [Candidatus Enterococcus clewellii]|uniref:Uncharacterized protein n=1 Tax=Candidatus Enterococcus clewellii TaxID=1834193 RepID=A0A242K3Q3_9ENTE|nr:hypothetical protein [Enterococcus sp. 9E7_DIV0242]OTP13543.1 hypothetical protein A5888_003021 [Enterococcus sp. 9E7_DIV0242]
MDFAFLAIMYFFVVVIIVLSFLLVKEKQLMYRLLDERDILQEDLNALKFGKLRLDQEPQMEEERMDYLMEEPEYEEESFFQIEENSKPKKHLESVFAENGATESSHFKSRERMIDRDELDRGPLRKERSEDEEEEEPYIVLNNRTLSRYEDELFRREEQ